jgi:archaellum component FlaF (FlaF/FlaG flagellin family)
MKASKGLLIAGGVIVAAGVTALLYQQYKLSEKLCYGASKFKILRLGLKSAAVGVNINIENKGELEVEIKRMKFDVYANGTYIASINQSLPSTIKPFDTASLPVTINFNPSEVFKGLKGILASTSLNGTIWEFKGSVTVKKWGIGLPIPLRLKYTTEQLMAPSTGTICD